MTWVEVLTAIRASREGIEPKELHRLADVTRRLILAMTSNRIPDQDVTRALTLVEEAVVILEQQPRQRLFAGFAESANSGDNTSFFDRSPVQGASNPLAPPLRLEHRVDDEGRVTIVGTATFSAAYEGPPGCVHGGFIAAAFDEVLGSAQSLSGNPGMTANLSINYKRPTPLFEEIVFEAELLRVEGRKIFTSGRSLHNGRVTAEGTGLFISVDFSRLADLAMKRIERVEGDA